MSYDIFFVRRDPGQTFEDALDELEASFENGDPGELTEVDLEHWDALLPLADEPTEERPPGDAAPTVQAEMSRPKTDSGGGSTNGG